MTETLNPPRSFRAASEVHPVLTHDIVEKKQHDDERGVVDCIDECIVHISMPRKILVALFVYNNGGRTLHPSEN